MQCFSGIFSVPPSIKLIVVMGDNDVGGEGQDIMSDTVVRYPSNGFCDMWVRGWLLHGFIGGAGCWTICALMTTLCFIAWVCISRHTGYNGYGAGGHWWPHGLDSSLPTWVRVLPVSGRFFFLQTLVSPHCPGVHSALPQKIKRCFTASFGGDVKLSVLGDLARLAPGYSRPSLATTTRKGIIEKKKDETNSCSLVLRFPLPSHCSCKKL